jgi:prefoldin subunit 5
MENKKPLIKQIVIGVLIVLLLVSLGYTYQIKSEASEMKVYLTEEKENIQGELDKMISQYDDAIAQNSSLSEELEKERALIIVFRDSVSNLKDTNKSIIRRYRGKIATIDASNKELFERIEQLQAENVSLNKNIKEAYVEIENRDKKIDTLNQFNTELTDKVTTGSILKVNAVKVNVMRRTNGGQLKETTRSRNTDALRVSFIISENQLAEVGSREVHVQVLNPAGDLVLDKGTAVLNDGATEIQYSDGFDVEFVNDKLEVINVVEVNRKEIDKGEYTVNVYLDGRFVGLTNFTLK